MNYINSGIDLISQYAQEFSFISKEESSGFQEYIPLISAISVIGTGAIAYGVYQYRQFNYRRYWLQEIQSGRAILAKIPKLCWNNREILLAAVRRHGWALLYAPDALSNDREIVLTAVQNEGSGSALQFASDALRNDREIVLAAVQNDGSALQFASNTLQNDREIVFAALRNNGLALKYASPALQNDPEVVLAAVQRDFQALDYASLAIRDDREIVLAAIRQHGLALQYASPALQNDPEVVLAAVQRDFQALDYASLAIRDDREIVLAAIRQNGRGLQYASDTLRNDREIVLAAIHQNALAIQYASMRLQLELEPFDNQLQNENILYVNLQRLENQPIQILFSLYAKLKENGFPQIQYINSPGIDHGGLSRDLVSRLFLSICNPENPHLPMNFNEGLAIPLIPTELADNDRQNIVLAYQAIGSLFAAAIRKDKNILSGNHFHSIVFKMIHTLSEEDLNNIPQDLSRADQIPALSYQKLFQIYAIDHLNISPETTDKIWNDQYAGLEGYGENKAEFLADYTDGPILAALVIAKAMKQSSLIAWGQIKGDNPEQLASGIEGTLSKEQVQNALEWTGNASEEYKNFLSTWIENSSKEDLAKWVQAVTGSKTLHPLQRLKIHLYEHQERLPTFHTCFFSMDLPNGYPSYDVFKEKLEHSLNSLEGFQMQ